MEGGIPERVTASEALFTKDIQYVMSMASRRAESAMKLTRNRNG